MKNPESPAYSDRRAVKSVSIAAEAPEAKEVVLTGEFTNWESEGIRLSKGRNGKWSATFQLPPGEYEYRLLVDGEWSDHSQASRRVSNPFGTENCVLVVD